MRATVYHGPRDMRIDQVPDPIIQAPTDVVARITHAGICGSDLWSYRGIDHRAPGERMGHEWMGMVEEVGTEVRTIKKTLYSQVFLDQFGKSPKNSEKGERSNGGNWAQASSPHRWLAWQDQDGPGGKRTSYKSVCLLGTSRSERIARCSSKQLCAHAAAVLAQRWQPHNSGGAATWQR